MERRFAGREVPLPQHWGGYRLQPATVEFWKGRRHRLHDRFRYRRSGTGWLIERLYP
jgi:pyridoxamine 5'-phosphate oxidase